jgi:hypothetical protein
MTRGPHVVNASAWGLDYSTHRNGDTISVVLWSRNGSSLPTGTYDSFLNLEIAGTPQLNETWSLQLADVASVSAGGQGYSANIHVGAPAAVSVTLQPVIQARVSQNFPNPCNPSTTVRFYVPDDGHVSLRVYDAAGQEVKTIVNETMSAGEFDVAVPMLELPSGVYFYRFSGTGFSEVRKMVLIK